MEIDRELVKDLLAYTNRRGSLDHRRVEVRRKMMKALGYRKCECPEEYARVDAPCEICLGTGYIDEGLEEVRGNIQ